MQTDLLLLAFCRSLVIKSSKLYPIIDVISKMNHWSLLIAVVLSACTSDPTIIFREARDIRKDEGAETWKEGYQLPAIM